jgi:hypothetical protein
MININRIRVSFGNKENKEKINRAQVLEALKKLNEKFHFERISPEDFVSDAFGYTSEDIAHDQKELEQKRVQYKELSPDLELQKAKADLLERVIIVGVAKLKWFGENTNAFLTSEYDDEINYIDGLIEFLPPKKVERYRLLGLNFDATFTSNLEGISTKILALKNDLDRYNIPKAKYFKNPVTDMNGVQLPKVVLGCDSESINRLVEIINKGDFEALANDPVQDKLLSQAEKQLSEFKIRFGRSAHYYNGELEKAKRERKGKDVIDELELSYRKAQNLFDMHSQVGGLIGIACSKKGVHSMSKQKEFFEDAVHQKIMITAEQINPKKKDR